MAYGDIINNSFAESSQYREKDGVETVNRAVLLKDASTKGSAAVNHLSNHLNLNKLGPASDIVFASNRAGIYVGTQGDLCVLLSGQSQPLATGTATATTTNKLVDSNAGFRKDAHITNRDIVVNTTDNTAAFVGNLDSSTQLALVDISNSASDIMASGETYEIYRAVLFQNVAAGSFLPIQVDRVFALGTTADDIIAIY